MHNNSQVPNSIDQGHKQQQNTNESHLNVDEDDDHREDQFTDEDENENRVVEVEKKKHAFLSSIEHSVQHAANCFQNKTLLLKTILSGQILSLMLSATGTAATALSTKHGIRTPCFNAFLMYVLLAGTFGIYTITRKEFKTIIKRHWWKYLLVALFDVEANYLLTKAYSYTTLTSVQLCDSFTIPTTMIISFIFLRIRYKIIHYAGVILCISGAVCLVFVDGKDKKENASNEVLGDVIALIAAVLYGTSNVGQEYLVKKYSSRHYLGIVGIVGFVVAGVQTVILERNDISDIQWNWSIGMIFVAFAVCQYFYYTVMPIVMKLSSATVVNLSLLTSDLYTLMIGLFLFGYKFSYMYFVAFSGIMIGLITYNVKPPPEASRRKKKNLKKRQRSSGDCTETFFKLENGNTIYIYKDEKNMKRTTKNGMKIPLLLQNGNSQMSYTGL